MCLKAGICSASLTSLGDEGRGAVALNPADWSRQSLDPVSTGVCPFHSSRSVSLATKLSLGNGWSLICLPKNLYLHFKSLLCHKGKFWWLWSAQIQNSSSEPNSK